MKGFVYVLEWSTGVVKVGKARDARKRIATHKAHAAPFGVSLLQEELIECFDCSYAETMLISWISKRSTKRIGREWHSGVPFDQVCEYARSLADKAVPARLILESANRQYVADHRAWLAKQPAA